VDIRKWIWKGGIMGERVKELRKALGLSGEKFGEKIGVTRSAISDIERGRNGLSDSNIIAICREFNVNEEWLRTGMGEMFKDMSLDEEIISFIGEIQWDTSNTFKKRFISAISKLSEEEWNVLEKIIVDMASNIEENKKEVIDGQQRLTTLMLLLRAFYVKFNSMKTDESKKTKDLIAKCLWKTDEFGTANTNELKIDSEVATDKDKDEFLEILRTGIVEDRQTSKYAKNYRSH